MTSTRTIATVTGWLFLLTFIGSIPAQLVLYAPLLKDPLFILGSGPDAGISLGALLELVVVVANIGTAVVLYPLVRRQNETIAISYVAARIVESTVIMVGIFSVLSVLALRQGIVGGAGEEVLVPIGQALVALHDASFLLGPGFLAGLGNGILLGYLMFRSGLVPRGLALIGLVGGPLLILAMVGVLFGAFAPGSLWQVIATVPEFLWELFLGMYLIVKGFKPSPITEGFARQAGQDAAAMPAGALRSAGA
ncbi:MAG: DUF4386 domain-containing protein [Chloroflexota bacterium]|nr:DUF4386 domain-containing protein [Chloroflexota bacterium]